MNPPATPKKLRWVRYAGLLMLLGVIALLVWPHPVPVEIAPVTRGTLQSTINEQGRTRIRERFVVSTPVSGQLRRIPFKAGAPVTAGATVLAVIDPLPPTPLDARARALAEAQRDIQAALLEKARAAHGFAQSELRRIESLRKEEAVSIEALETARTREIAAGNDLAAATHALRQAEAELAQTSVLALQSPPSEPVQILAPVTGQILRLFEESSRVLGPGAPLLEIGDPLDLEAVIEVLSRDAAILTPGSKAQLLHWGGATPLEARVRLIEPAGFTKISALGVEEQRVNVILDLVTPPDQRTALGDNFRVEARIVAWEASQVLKAPTGALFRRGTNWAAFVVTDGRAHLRELQTGLSGEAETHIISGLNEGDLLILYPGNRVADGQRVKQIEI